MIEREGATMVLLVDDSDVVLAPFQEGEVVTSLELVPVRWGHVACLKSSLVVVNGGQ